MPSFFKKLTIILCLSFLLQACSYFSNDKNTKGDNYAGWTVEQFIAEGKENLADEKYKKAIKVFEQQI